MASTSSKGGYVTWSYKEVTSLIATIDELECLHILDGKRQRNKDVFEKVAEKLACPGKDMIACRSKYKKLKEKYKEERSAASKSGEEEHSISYQQSDQESYGFLSTTTPSNKHENL